MKGVWETGRLFSGEVDMGAVELRAFQRRKAWRRVTKAGRSPFIRLSFFWVVGLMFASEFVGAAVGAAFFEAVVPSLYSCVRVS